MNIKAAIATAFLLAAAALGAMLGCDRSSGAPSRPGTVVLVTLDTFRCDRIGAYGRAPSITPALDSLAKRGVRFERCLTVAPITLPAHASILSGVDPIAHCLRVNDARMLPPDVPLLQETLRSAGYATGAFVSAAVLDHRFGLARGFDVYDDARGADADPGPEERLGERTVDAALAWLDARGNGAAFLWVHLFDAHAPYAAPAAFAAKHPIPYEAEMAYVDACVERLLKGLDARGRGETSLVCVVADHGEGLGDHGESTHTIFVYDTTIHVPLLLAGAGLPAGKVVAGTASTISIAPTLLDLLGVAKPARMYGTSLADAARSGGAVQGVGGVARFESQAAEYYYGFAPLSGIERDAAKLIVAPRPELYFPAHDPGETRDEFAAQPSVADARKRDLDACERERAAGCPDPIGVEGALEDSLRQLGYVQRKVGRSRDAKDGIAEVEVLIRVGLRAQRDLLGAIEELESIVSRDPSIVDAHELLGDFCRDAGQLDRAAAAYLAAIELRTGDAGLFVKRAGVLLRNGKFEAARDALLQGALAIEPGHSPARALLAQVLLEMRDFDRALAEARRVVEGDPALGLLPAPARADAWLVFGFAAAEKGDREAGQRGLEKGLALAPRDVSLLLALGKLAERLEDRVAACLAYSRARELMTKKGGAGVDPRLSLVEGWIAKLGC